MGRQRDERRDPGRSKEWREVGKKLKVRKSQGQRQGQRLDPQGQDKMKLYNILYVNLKE